MAHFRIYVVHSLLAAAIATSTLSYSSTALAQETAGTTATVEAAEDESSTASLAPLAVMTPGTGSEESEPVKKADAAATRTVVLVGEKVSLENPASAKGPFPDLVTLTENTVGGRVVDLTTHGLTMAETTATLGKVIIQRPQVIIVFTGFTDEKKSTSDDEQRLALKEIVKGL